MRQSWHDRHASRPSTSFWQRHHKTFTTWFWMVIVHDIVNGIVGAWLFFNLFQKVFLVLSHIVLLFQLIATCFFIICAMEFTAPIRAYFGCKQRQIKSGNVGIKSDHYFGQLLFWLAMSSIFMIIHTLVNATVLVVFLSSQGGMNFLSYSNVQNHFELGYCLFIGLTTTSRLLISSTVRPSLLV